MKRMRIMGLGLVAVFAVRSEPWGVTRTETSASPCLPLGVPPVDAPLSAVRMTPNARALTMSVFGTNCEVGMTTPLTF